MDKETYINEIKHIRDELSETELVDFDLQFSDQKKDPDIALILSLFLGFLGVDRLYLGQTFLGLVKMFTLGGFGMWAIADWFLISSDARIQNIKIAEKILLDQNVLE